MIEVDFSMKNVVAFQDNPRYISKKERGKLKSSLKDFGDLSGIVINVRTGEIISGNQRSDILSISNCSVLWESNFDPPTDAGTVAIGHTYIDGEPFRVRLVDWDEITARIANLSANKLGGSFDMDILVNWDFAELEAGGFEKEDFIGYNEDEEDDFLDDDDEDLEEDSSEDEVVYRLVIDFNSEEEAKQAKIFIQSFLSDENIEAKISEVK